MQPKCESTVTASNPSADTGAADTISEKQRNVVQVHIKKPFYPATEEGQDTDGCNSRPGKRHGLVA